jgi:hypothetical protein
MMPGTKAAPVKGRDADVRPAGAGEFTFLCGPEAPCFTACCADLRLPLTPYDILRMKNRLRLSSGEFIERYTKPFEGECAFPLIALKMRDDEGRACPFVSPRGCAVYEDRPGACRLYPLGRAADVGRSGKEEGALYFLVEESHCLGFQNSKQWTVEEWVENQGAGIYNEMNRPWIEIVMNERGVIGELSERRLAMFSMASYNLDRFREFVFQTKFLSAFDVSAEEKENLAIDEIELMNLAMRWLRFSFFGEDALIVKGAGVRRR